MCTYLIFYCCLITFCINIQNNHVLGDSWTERVKDACDNQCGSCSEKVEILSLSERRMVQDMQALQDQHKIIQEAWKEFKYVKNIAEFHHNMYKGLADIPRKKRAQECHNIMHPYLDTGRIYTQPADRKDCDRRTKEFDSDLYFEGLIAVFKEVKAHLTRLKVLAVPCNVGVKLVGANCKENELINQLLVRITITETELSKQRGLERSIIRTGGQQTPVFENLHFNYLK